MLEIRPNCELCDKDLPVQSREVRICSYECTYCAECCESILHNVCPTCGGGGGFAPRPIRPKTTYRTKPKLGLAHHPASQTRKLSQWSKDEITELVNRLKSVPSEER